MQTRDYDDYIYVNSTLGFRKVTDDGTEIVLMQETDGYCNMYADNISVSYLHSMNDFEVNAIHNFEENHQTIFSILLNYLKKTFLQPKSKLGFSHVNILYEHKDIMCFTEYVFIDEVKNKISIMMHKDSIIKNV